MKNFKSIMSRVMVAMCAAVAVLSMPLAAMAQDPPDPPTIDSTSTAMGIDIAALLADLLDFVGDWYLGLLLLGIVCAGGWIAFGHFKKGARQK